jgi:hypothetical protein
MVETDSVTFGNYPPGVGLPRNTHTFSYTSNPKNKTLETAQSELNKRSQELTGHTDLLIADYSALDDQIKADSTGITGYLTDYDSTNSKIKEFNDMNVTSIVTDSEINVLKENYSYISWSILAVGGAILTMCIAKSQ